MTEAEHPHHGQRHEGARTPAAPGAPTTAPEAPAGPGDPAGPGNPTVRVPAWRPAWAWRSSATV